MRLEVEARSAAFGRTPKVEGRTGVPAAHLAAQLLLVGLWTFAALNDALHGRMATAAFAAVNIALLLYGIWAFIGPRAFAEDLSAGVAPLVRRVTRIGSRAGGMASEG